MAITNIQGTVTRVFFNGKGAEVTETSNSGGKEYKTRWKCWFEQPHGLSEGQPVKVSGFHGDKIAEWTDREGKPRTSVERSLNKAKLGDGPEPVQASQEPSWPVQEPWGGPTVDQTQVPF